MGRNSQDRLAGSLSPASPDPADIADRNLDGGVETGGIGYFLIAVPKAVGYYMVSIPLMALNPIGTIRKGIENQKFPPMGAFPLIAYALPAFLFYFLVASVCQIIASFVTGTFSMGQVIPGLPISAGIAIAASAVNGFVWHPLLRWIVVFLKGESDEKSRTNYFIAFLTAFALTAIPTGAAFLLGLVRLPFLNLVPLVITLYASLVTFFVLYSWMKHFNIVSWAQKVLMVLGVLLVVSTGYGLANAVIDSIKMLGGDGSDGALAGAPTGDVTPEEAAKLAQEALAKSGVGQEQAEDMAKEAMAKSRTGPSGEQDAMKKAAEAEAKEKPENEATGGSLKAGEGPSTEDPPKQEDALAPTPTKQEKEKEKSKVAAPDPSKRTETTTEIVRSDPQRSSGATISPEVLAALEDAVRRASGPKTPFREFLDRRAEIEKAIEDDPALLRRKDIHDSYEKLLRKTNDIRQKWVTKGKKKKDYATDKINERLKDAEVFEQTSKLVSELHGKLFK